MIRAHHAPHESGMNAAERSNAAIGDAIVDSGTVDWKHYMPFDGLTDEVISNLTTEDADKLKKTATERNAWWVAHELKNQVNDEPGPAGDYTKAFLASTKDERFFIKQEVLKRVCFSSIFEQKEVYSRSQLF